MNIDNPVKMPCFKCLDKKYIFTGDIQSGKIPCPVCNGRKNELGQIPDYEAIWPKSDIKVLEEMQKNINEKIVAMSPLVQRIENLELESSTEKQTREAQISIIDEKMKYIISALDNYREYRTGIEDLETDVMYLKERIEKLEENLPKNRDAIIFGLLERIEKLENEKVNLIRYEVLNELLEKISRLESENDHHCGAITVLERKIEKLESNNSYGETLSAYDQVCKDHDSRIKKLEELEKQHVISWGRLTEENKILQERLDKYNTWLIQHVERIEKLEKFDNFNNEMFANQKNRNHEIEERICKLEERNPELYDEKTKIYDDRAKLLEFVKWCRMPFKSEDNINKALDIIEKKSRDLLLEIEGY